MNDRKESIRELHPEQVLQLKQKIFVRWDRLPAEHQATMLPVLLDHSAWAPWSVWTWLALNPIGGEGV